MALTDDELELYKVGKAALPSGGADVPDEMLASAAKAIDPARQRVKGMYSAGLILRSTGNDLDALARDLGAARQGNEQDAALQSRLRGGDPAITPQALIDAAQAIVTARGIVGTVALVQLRADRAFLGTFAATGYHKTFCSRGYRLGHEARPHVVVMILPYGTDAGTAASVQQILNRKVGGGVVARVEVRGTP